MNEDFEKKLKQYKEGKLDQKDVDEVQNEINKYLAIMDFLDEDSKITVEPVHVLPPKSQIKSLKRKLNFKFISIAFIMILFIVLTSIFVYNVSGNVISDIYNKNFNSQFKMGYLHRDIEMYFANILPETYVGTKESTLENKFAQTTAAVTYTKSLGKTKLDELSIGIKYSLGKPDHDNSNNLNAGNLFSAAAWESDFYLTSSIDLNGYAYADHKAFDELKKLPDNVQAEVWLSFNKAVPITQLEKLLDLESENNQFCIKFRAVDTGLVRSRFGNCDGANFNNKIILGCNEQSLIDIGNKNGVKYSSTSTEQTQDWYNTNYLSLLKEMQKNQDIIKIIFENSTGLNNFNLDIDNRIAYVEKNGVNCIGAVVCGSKNEILKLQNNTLICGSDLRSVTVW